MKKNTLVIACIIAISLTACGKPKMEDLIADAYQAKWANSDSQKAAEELLENPLHYETELEISGDFNYSDSGVSIGGDVGVGLEMEIAASGMTDEGIDIEITGSLSLTLPEILTSFGLDLPDDVPIEMYAHIDEDFEEVTAYVNRGAMDGGADEWVVSSTTFDDLQDDAKEQVSIDSKAQIDDLRELLIAHSVLRDKTEKFDGNEVYVLDFEVSLDDKDARDFFTSMIADKDQAQKVKDFLKDAGEYITIRYTYYITAKEHTLVYLKADFSDIDVASILDATVDGDSAEFLSKLDININDAYWEFSFLSPEEVEIPRSVIRDATSVYDFDVENGNILTPAEPLMPAKPGDETDISDEIIADGSSDDVEYSGWGYPDIEWSSNGLPGGDVLGSYNGVDYPSLTLRAFEDDGWYTTSGDGEYSFTSFENSSYGDISLYLYDAGWTGTREGLEKKVAGYDIRVDWYHDGDKLPNMTWSGLTFGASSEDVFRLYGEPYTYYEGSFYTSYEYDFGNAELTFYINEGQDDTVFEGLIGAELTYYSF